MLRGLALKPLEDALQPRAGFGRRYGQAVSLVIGARFRADLAPRDGSRGVGSGQMLSLHHARCAKTDKERPCSDHSCEGLCGPESCILCHSE